MLLDQPIVTKSAQETKEFGRNLAEELLTSSKGEGARVICLYGELGSGKTTFVQGFARGLGIDKRILSPTFVIVRRYSLSQTGSGFFYHLDLYRLHSDEELEELGLAEMFADSGSFVLIEWAEKIGTNLPDKRIDIHFSVKDEGNHVITIKRN